MNPRSGPFGSSMILRVSQFPFTNQENFQQPQQRLMWLHLATRGAPPGRRPIEYKFPAREQDADYKPLINTMALVATLIATVTFAAAFTMPGGYDTSPNNLGVANLIKTAALKVFIVSDTIAMSCSITAVLALALSVIGGREFQRRICIMSWVLVSLAMRGTLVAFMCGIFVVIAPKALWVAILVCIICSTATLAVELSLPFLNSPSIIDFIRYLKQELRKGLENYSAETDRTSLGHKAYPHLESP